MELSNGTPGISLKKVAHINCRLDVGSHFGFGEYARCNDYSDQLSVPLQADLVEAKFYKG